MSKSIFFIFVLWLLAAATGLGDDSGTKVAKRKPGAVTVEARGTLQPEEVVEVMPQVPGRIQEFGADPQDRSKTVDYGTRVEAGTILVRLDPTLYQTRAERARFQLDKARAILKSARNQAAAGNVRQAEVEQADADVQLAQAVLKEAEARLVFTTIRSPIKGVIIDRRVNIGQNVGVNPKLPSLFLVGKLDRLQLWAQVKEADIGKIRPGQAVRFTTDAFPSRSFKGMVAKGQPRLNAALTENQVTYTVIINVDNSNGNLLPYLTAHVEFIAAE